MSHNKRLLSLSLKDLVAQAEQAGACSTELDTLRGYSDMQELLDKAEPESLAYWAYWYAREVIQGRWPEAEGAIVLNSYWAYCYAKCFNITVEDLTNKLLTKDKYENI